MVDAETISKYTHHLPFDVWSIIPAVGKSGDLAFGHFEKSSIEVLGSPGFVVVNKLKNVKTDLIKWNRNSFGHIKTIIGRLNSELEKLQALPYSPQIGGYILNYSQQNMYNTIHTIRDDQGNWIENREQVADFLSKHFKKIYTTSIPGNKDIEEALSIVSYSVLVNGSPGDTFFPTRGIRQDDCMLFAKASITYARNLIKIINVFAKASGRAINFEKSGFITSGKDKTKSFNFLIDNFYARLSSSKKSNLNVAGRTVVTKHVLSSLAIYHMACFPLTKTVTSKIDVIQRTFWWSKKNPKHAAYFRSWGDIGKAKSSGGLGIRNTYATNRVFICRLGWRIINNPNILLTTFLKDKYFPNQNLLEIDKAADTSSWIWKGIVKGLHFIRANSVVKINNGVSTRIWSSNWIPGFSNPPISAHSSHSNYIFVNDLIDNHNKCWNASLLSTLFSPGDVIRIRSIRLNLNQCDSLIWAHTRNALGISPFRVSWTSIGAIVMWCIWKLRCDVLFRQTTIDLNKVILETEKMINTYIAPPVCSGALVRDYKVPLDVVNHFMFSDGFFKDFKMSLGVIWCDISGKLKSSRSDFGLIPDAIGAEVASLILAISWAEEMNLSKVVFISDCLQLVDYVNGVSSNITWRSEYLLNQCRVLISSSCSFEVVFVKRVKNHLADRLARRARNFSLKGLWVSYPSFLISLVRKENLNVVCNWWLFKRVTN
ncbi:uncharacterized protein LOC113296355 [Papaver somniferum]|uniref:uncharacterized protein LOC113296355 n=1 Tax=Papaver somniferum TaxID=3469 RepID=UPI000E6F9C2C|nr:uncharacterized protein LOC113296355 [Papaver somniferum]